MRDRCVDCRFFSGLIADSTECRKNPPNLITIVTPGGPQTFGVFPPTKKENWCGAFERAPQIDSERTTS